MKLARFVGSRILLAAFWMTAVVVPGFAAAAAKSAEEEKKESVAQMAEVVVTGEKPESSTATFGDRKVLDTPFSVGVVDHEAIEDQRAFTRREVLKNDPSVNLLLGYIGDDAFTIRGFTNRWANDMIRVDGMPVAFVRGGTAAVEEMDRVEVLKGVAALRYGFAPPGGVVNYVRKRPGERDGLSLSVDGRSNGNVLGIADASGYLGPGGQVGYRIVASTEKIEGFQDYTDGDRRLLSGLFTWSPKAGVELELALDDQRRASGFEGMIPIAADTKRIFLDLPRTFSWYAPNAEYATEARNLVLGGSFELAEDLKLKAKGQYGEGMEDYDMYGYGGWALDDGSLDLYEWYGITHQVGLAQQVHLEGKFKTGDITHDLAFGFSFYRQEARGANSVFDYLGTFNVYSWPPATPISLGNEPFEDNRLTTRTDEWGVFLTDFIGITPEWEVLLGARLADLRVQDFWNADWQDPDQYHEYAVSPSAALSFKPRPGWNAYAVYSEGLQQGGVAPLGTTNYQEHMPPIRIQQGEVGLKVEQEDWAATFAAFYIRMPLEYTDDTLTYVQNGKQDHQGLEGSFSVNATEGVRLTAGGMFLDANQVDTGDPTLDGRAPDGAMRFQGNVGAEVGLAEGFTLGSTLYYVGRKPVGAAEDLFLPGYGRWDAGLKYAFRAMENDCILRLNLQNLADNDYIESAGFWGFGAGEFGGWAIYGVPLNATLSLETQL